jgi:hypothetical protein
MNMNRRQFLLPLSLLLLLLLSGCRLLTPAETPLPPPPTAAPPTEPAAPEILPTPTLPPPPTAIPTAVANTPTPEPTPAPTATPEPAFQTDASYRVIFVEADDTLNVRSGPGVQNPVVTELAPDAAGIRVTGPGEQVDDWLWLPIEANGVSGWVNSLHLTEMVSEVQFCNEMLALSLITNLRTAVAQKDGQALAKLVHPEHGLTIHRHWWNPAVRFEATAVADLFTSEESYYWGREDGTGFDMNGSFMDYIYPRLERNLLPARVLGCNEIMHGGTAGYVWLPEGYENVNFYAVYRPHAEDQFEMDWGTWVVGIERWQGQYYISYLVHFEWEI